MARADVENGKLRGCPVCGTKVEKAQLALRDFSWVNESLPGKLGGMDVDFVLSQFKTGRVLHIEMKPTGVPISLGAKMTYAVYRRHGLDAWAVWGPDEYGRVERGYFDTAGKVRSIEQMPVSLFAEEVALWWAAGDEHG